MESDFDWYSEFVDIGYSPSDNELICVFDLEPSEGFTLEGVAGRVAAESSVGTWTTLHKLPKRVKKLKARVFKIEGSRVLIAYPPDLFEFGNIPQLLSSVAGNIFGMKAVKNLRLVDVRIPNEYVKSFRGPEFGIEGIRETLKIRDRPLTATVPKPKLGYDADEYARVAYEAWTGGIDLVKDDENLTSQSFVKFEKRLERVMKARDRAEKETGERKSYLINITAKTHEMLRRAKMVAEHGNEYVMIDIITVGWAALQTVRDACGDLGLAIHAHRAMHAAFTRNPKHGISMKVIAKLARLVGVDQIHIGTAVGKMAGEAEEILELNEEVKRGWLHIRPVFPVSSGGLHPGIVPDVIRLLGTDLVIQVGGGVHGHPDGTFSGARALRQAINAVISGVPIEDFAEKHKELKRALEKWGKIRPA